MKIRKIEPFPKFQMQSTLQNKKLKVACYVRVSTAKDEQKNSFAAQIDFYTKKIKMNREWEFAGEYHDNGISGTSKENRSGFNQLIEDALSGKIDLILTKSISRFARNTVDNIQTIRKLQEKNVVIYFEKEDIWTNDKKGEFLLTLMASFAQEESRSISENTTWGLRRRFENGKYSVNFSWFLGYKRGKDGEFIIDVKQAEIVREMYLLLLQGYSPHQIGKLMEENSIPAPSGKSRWWLGTVESILTNEKYKGDALLQKYYTVDFLTHKQAKNRGEVEQFYVSGGHDAIIPPDVFDYVQEKLKVRKDKRHSGVRLFSGKIICGQCGCYYGSRPWHSTTYNNLAWQCKKQVDSQCRSKRIYDMSIQIFLDALLSDICDMELKERVYDLLGVEGDRLNNIKEEMQQLIKGKVLLSDLSDWAFIISKIIVQQDVLELHFIDEDIQIIPFPVGTPCCTEWQGWR